MVLDLKRAPSGQTIVKPTALGPVANTDTKLLIYGLFQSGRVLAQDGHKLSVAGRLAIDGETQLKQSPGKPGAVHAMGITVTRVTCLPLSGFPCARYNT